MNSQLEPTYQQMVGSMLEKAEKEAMQYAAAPDRFNFTFVQVDVQTDEGMETLYGAPGAWACTCPRNTVLSMCSHSMALDILLEKFLPQPMEEIHP